MRTITPTLDDRVTQSRHRFESREKAAIADMLNANKSLKLYVVGHTDMTGGFDYNVGLSLKRADAVVKALVSNYGIAAQRLAGKGAGPLSPVGSNKNESGRKLNRRVELVER